MLVRGSCVFLLSFNVKLAGFLCRPLSMSFKVKGRYVCMYVCMLVPPERQGGKEGGREGGMRSGEGREVEKEVMEGRAGSYGGKGSRRGEKEVGGRERNDGRE